MKGDFTRNTFRPNKHFTRVLMQQGRVQLDADWNELNSILLYYLRTFITDLTGPHGGPGDGFKIGVRRDRNNNPVPCDFEIQSGHYYVNGILCENDAPLAYTAQPDYPLAENEDLATNAAYLVYLDVWERHVSSYEDDTIREVALGGPDTASRARAVWQVKAVPAGKGSDDENVAAELERLQQRRDVLQKELEIARERGDEAKVAELEKALAEIEARIRALQEEGDEDDGAARDCDSVLRARLAEAGIISDGRLAARAFVDRPTSDPCIIPPEAQYRGAENQLYRVEIHRGGVAGGAEGQKAAADGPTFVWSRDNAAKAVYPILSLTTSTGGDAPTTTVEVEHLGHDSRFTLTEGDWVEIVDDDYTLRNRDEPLLKVTSVDRDAFRVTLAGAPSSDVGRLTSKHPLLRRWDSDGELPVQVPAAHNGWIALEDGIEVKFEDGARYGAGDYWLISARTATGNVEWPQIEGPDGRMVPASVDPHGVMHYYAPLARLSIANDGAVTINEEDDCRCVWEQPCGE